MKTLQQFIIESVAKDFINLKKGDKLYFCSLDYDTSDVNEGVDTFVSSSSTPETEYMNASLEIKCEKDRYFIDLSDIHKSCAQYHSRAIIATNKEDVENWKKSKLPHLKNEADNHRKSREDAKKRHEENKKRYARGEFKSKQEEIDYWEDFYDHDTTPEENAKRDKALRQKLDEIEAKWNVDGI